MKLEGDSLTDCLEERLGDLESLTTRALLDREALASERRRAMAVLTAAGTGNEIDPQILIQQDLGIEVYSACNQVLIASSSFKRNCFRNNNSLNYYHFNILYYIYLYISIVFILFCMFLFQFKY